LTAYDLIASSAKIPVDADGPVFAEPWQARVFAMTLQAHDAGAFTWPEWAEALGKELARDPEGRKDYYAHWLATFEALLTSKGVAAAGALSDLRKAWEKAAQHTPHGEPITLGGHNPTSGAG